MSLYAITMPTLPDFYNTLILRIKFCFSDKQQGITKVQNHH
jgi:hypothetical protein